MAATTMPSINSVLEALKRAHPKIKFIKSDEFRWSPEENTVFYVDSDEPLDLYNLLHEVSHAVLKHQNYKTDIELVQKEAEAWHYAESIFSKKFGVSMPSDTVEDEIDTYRDWLHQRSTCPDCSQNGLQIQNDTYECLNCRCRWRVNEARQCGLKRYKLS